ncbi:hypothetical protein H0H93_013262 [Arthromyces matolae]|nr:hypothetical protein H0H93_013262 [Arthromyces matolae]
MSSFSTLPEPSPAPFHDVHSFLANDTDDDDADTASQRSISLSSPPDSRRQSTLDEVPLQTTDFHSTFFNKRAAYEDSEDSSSMITMIKISLHRIPHTHHYLPEEKTVLQYRKPFMIPSLNAQEKKFLGGDSAAPDDFNPVWISEFRKTNAYEVWQKVTDPVIFDIVEPRHPCNEKPSVVADIGLRLQEGIQDLKLEQQLAPAREAVSRAVTVGSANFFKAVEGVRERWGQSQAQSAGSGVVGAGVGVGTTAAGSGGPPSVDGKDEAKTSPPMANTSTSGGLRPFTLLTRRASDTPPPPPPPPSTTSLSSTTATTPATAPPTPATNTILPSSLSTSLSTSFSNMSNSMTMTSPSKNLAAWGSFISQRASTFLARKPTEDSASPLPSSTSPSASTPSTPPLPVSRKISIEEKPMPKSPPEPIKKPLTLTTSRVPPPAVEVQYATYRSQIDSEWIDSIHTHTPIPAHTRSLARTSPSPRGYGCHTYDTDSTQIPKSIPTPPLWIPMLLPIPMLLLWLSTVFFSFHTIIAAPTVSLISNTLLDSNGIFFISYDGVVNVNSFQLSAVLTYSNYQYAAWYTATNATSSSPGVGTVTLARRVILPSQGAWSTLRLPHTLSTQDSHNVVVLGVSPADGKIHVAMDCHSSPMFYTSSEAGFATSGASWVASRFGSITTTLGNLNIGTTITYPQFVITPTNLLQFVYRTGISGNGATQLAEYNNGVWSNVGSWASATGTYTSTNGVTSSARNLYIHGFTYGGNRLHVTGTWREQVAGVSCSSGGLTNHDTTYFYSDDKGRTWFNSAGTSIGTSGSNPINVNTAGIIIDSLNADHGLMNQESQVVDSQGQIHSIISYVPGRFTQCVTNYESDRIAYGHAFHLYRSTTNGVSSFTKFEIPFFIDAVGRSQIVLDGNDNAYVVLPYVRIVTASKASGWTDWTLVYDGVAQGLNAFGEVTVDRTRVSTSGVLSVLYQVNSTGTTTPSAVRVVDFNLNG